jgi:hypothetical protein
MTSHPEVVAQIDGQLPESPLIVERSRQTLGFAETAEDPLEFSERKERGSQAEAKINGPLQRLASLGEMPGPSAPAEARHGLPIGRARQCLDASLMKVRDGLPHSSPRTAWCNSSTLGQPVRIAAFDGADDAGVQGLRRSWSRVP